MPVNCSFGQCVRPFALLCCATVLACGCASPPLNNPFEEMSPKTTAVKAAPPKSPLEKLFSSKSSPKTKAEEKAVAKPAAAKSSVKTVSHDATTQALIDHELRDALPQEREELLRELENVSSDMVPYILRARRMHAKYQQQAEQTAKATPKEPEQAKPVAGGLNPNNPWTQSPPTIRTADHATPPTARSGVGTALLESSAEVETPPQTPFGHSPAISPAAVKTAKSPPANPPPFTAINIKPAGATQVQQAVVTTTPSEANSLTTASVPVINEVAAKPSAAVVPTSASTESATESLQTLLSRTEAEVAQLKPGTTEAEKQAYIEKHVYLRMLYLMSDQKGRALTAIPGLNAADQEFWQQTFWGIANYFDSQTIPDSSLRVTQTVAQLTNAIQRLQEKANLELRNVSFCQKIGSFGNYERFPRDEFTPGQQVLLYAEVVNFHSQTTPDGQQYRTVLKSTLEIHKPGPQGELVERIQFPSPATEDVCRNHRRDYFQSYEFTIPARIALGPHVLKLTVEDQLSRKVASYSLNFTVN